MKTVIMALLVALTVTSCSKEKQERKTINLDVQVYADPGQWTVRAEFNQEVSGPGQVVVKWKHGSHWHDEYVQVQGTSSVFGLVVNESGITHTTKADSVTVVSATLENYIVNF